ncbi:MAG TPA: Crp/Fnr family transcriptional regulator [Allosphingosinicella sp.]|nr:Crp/Fnr family transcriptional regulator [Allosphingosinicella sp.]
MEEAGDRGVADELVLALLCRVFGCRTELGAHIRTRGRIKEYRPRAYIARSGDSISVLFAIIAGIAHALAYSSEGQPVLLHEYREGDVFGAIGSTLHPRHEADIIAATEVSSFLLDGRELALLAERHGSIGIALLKLMVDRLQRTEARMYEHAALSSVGRVYAELLRQASDAPDLTIRPAPVLTELALRVSTTRETVSRAVGALERRGIIQRSHDALTLVAPQRLEELIV